MITGDIVGGGMGSKAKAIAALLAVTCVCSIIALILSVVNVKDVLLSPSTKYGLVFDAGSTHTSLYIYRWPADKENDTGIVSQVEACSVSAPAGLTGRAQHFSLPGSGVCSASPGMPTALLLWLERKRLQRPGCVAMPQLLPPGRTAPSTEQGWTWQGPGISSYADDPVGAGASLKPCLDRAMKIVPAEQQRETPTYLGATAGMRLLREENSTKAEQVLAEVSKAIGEYPVDFRGARILTGSEEGSFGWITVNYLLETLVKLSLALCSRVPTHRWILGSQGYTWQQDQPPGDRVPFSLIKVSGCQQMCGSQEAAAQCSVEVSFSFAEKWEHPQDTEVLGALDLGGASTQITFQPGVPVEDRNTSVFFQLYGTNYSLYSHSYLCYGQSQALKMLLAALHQASSSAQISHPCYPQGYQENITVAELYDSPCAFAGFYYTFNFLNLTRQQSLSEVNTTVLSFCRRNWAELVQSFPRHLKYLHTYCSVAFYILTLLLDGYKFNEHTWSNIHFSRQAANTDIGWTLGFMLNLTNMFPAEALQRVKGHQPGLWAGAVSLLVLAIVAGLVAVFLHCSWKTK
ncbi:ectonucleoside triphosphate diphosphohydrolase 8-like isoform X3 [Vidua chalybeata]|uniref:ectonucleoside triphosphate diphosphohydrolase 8-like isoform X3 n=1 Tax=Vidua chalybeata TaxID=81927 RepID=UPI0023A7E196|nr:ectonucleoside triphosphate diphosphohydrolase 8-like isoform X3 [Vidua chalybeata]